MKSKIKNIITWAITVLIIVVSLWFAIKNINYSNLYSILLSADYKWVLFSIPIILFSHFIRAFRWKTIVKPFLPDANLLNLFSSVMVGYFFNSLFPRLGELVRPYVFAQREKTSVSSVFATIVFERVLDVITLGFLFAIAFFVARDKVITMLPGIDTNKIIGFSALVMAVIILSFYPPFVYTTLKYTIKPISEKLYHRLIDIYKKFLQGFAILKSPSLYFRLITESLLIWFLYSLPLYLMFFCFDFSNTIHVSLGDALFLLIVSGIGVTIAPTPSGIGVMHTLLTYAMIGLYGIDKETALAYATINHATTLFVQLFFGGIFTLREKVNKLPGKDFFIGKLENQSNS
ncbi:MAG TPA: lysylphosphatidylglycerol synthase transmembrane domain-containing protein [Candidatus Kapabacteria bacterium]|nr:lysylphosphatidylglycerol synthase transmembrane domain-containing protein [Candidatus Kapabacteria bacterium]